MNTDKSTKEKSSMTNLVRWDPFTDLRTTMDRLFDEGFSRPWRFMTAQDYEPGFPVEVSQTDNDIEVKASLPGIRAEDVDITVANGVLSIKAQHKEETEDKKRDYYRREIRYGSFHRSMSLPAGVDADKAEAHFDNGILSLRLPKAEALRPKQIKVSGPTDGNVVSGS
jgi:HSP20 family protein